MKFAPCHSDAQPITLSYEQPAGIDLSIVHLIKVENGIAYFGTGWTVDPGEEYYTTLHLRSSCVKKHHKYGGWTLGNNTGIIDSDYRGEIIVALQPTVLSVIQAMKEHPTLSSDDLLLEIVKTQPLPLRITQLCLHKKYPSDIHIVDELSNTKRGTGGFGSSV
jgi:dUTPase